MVLPTIDSETSDREGDSCSGRLLHDIEEISKALYLDKRPSNLLRPPSQLPSWSSGNNVVAQDALEKDKKSSIWKWKTLKVLNHFRSHRIKCCFFLRVHAIDGLPPNMNDIVLYVNWKRKNEVSRTRPVRVFQGLAQFEETLIYRCTVHGSRNGPLGSAKYKPKLSLLYASIIGAPALDIGKHSVDLTRLLPLTLDELEEKRTSGKWTTSFKLKGKAKGAFLSVSFGFSTLGNNPFTSNRLAEVSDVSEGSVLTNLDQFTDFEETSMNSHLHSFGSVPLESNNRFHHLPSRSIDLKFTDKVNFNMKFELPTQLTLLREKLDEKKPSDSEEFKLSDGHKELLVSNSAASSDFLSVETETKLDEVDFVVVDKGIELFVKDESKRHDSCESFSGFVIDATEITGNLPEELMICNENEVSITEHKLLNEDSCESTLENDNKNVDIQDDESNFRGPLVDSPEILAAESAPDTDNNLDCLQDEESNLGDRRVVPSEILTFASGLDTDSKNDGFQDEGSNLVDPQVVPSEKLASESAVDTDEKKDDLQDEAVDIEDHQAILPDILSSESALDIDEKTGDLHDEAVDVEDPQAILSDTMSSELAEFDFLVQAGSFIKREYSMNAKRNDISGTLARSLSMDDVTESVANEFIGKFTDQVPGETSSDSDPDSPRERLLKQFEKECPEFGDAILFSSTASKDTEFGLRDKANKGRMSSSDDSDWTLVIQEAEREHTRVMQSLKSRRNAKMLENLETETLMQRWGLNEKAFQHSPRLTSGGFGSPVYIPPEEPSELPPLGEGLGPTIRTRKGGILRSMNTSLFKNAKNGAKLVLQVSNPIVLPAVLGSSVLEILQGLASVGPECLLAEVNELMPLEDITGKTMQQVMLEAQSSLNDRWAVLDESSSFVSNNGEETINFQNSHSISLGSVQDEASLDFVSFGDLVPLLVANVETLSIEGLKIQSGLSNEEAPCHSRAIFTGNWSSTGWNDGKHGESTIRKLLDVKDGDDIDVDDLIRLSVSLDQWLKFDAEDIGSGHVDERMLKTLAAHHADFNVLQNLQLSRDGEEVVHSSSSNSGLLTNNFTVALRLQLRDPFRDYESVGGSLLVLSQVERVCVPLDTHRSDKNAKLNPKFKVSEVHVAGLKVDDIDDKQILTTRRQLQTGYRWLNSNGMINKGKHRFSNSNALVKASSSQLLKKQPGDILWSVLAPVEHEMANSRRLNVHFRNPDIVFPN